MMMFDEWRSQRRRRKEEEARAAVRSFMDSVMGRYPNSEHAFRRALDVDVSAVGAEVEAAIAERRDARSDEAVQRARARLARVHKAMRVHLAMLPEGRRRVMFEMMVEEIGDLDPDLK